MALSPVDEHKEGHTQHVCEFCDTKKVVKWKCLDCGFITCDESKDKIHRKIKRGKDHRIINIHEKLKLQLKCTKKNKNKILEHSIYCKVNKEIHTQEKVLINAVKYAKICRRKLDKSHTEISSIEENIDAISRSMKQFEGKYNELEDFINTADVAEFFQNVGGIARKKFTASNNLLIATGKSRLQQICCITGKLTDSMYQVHHFSPYTIHVTSQDKVMQENRKKICVSNGCYGHQETVHELDQEKTTVVFLSKENN
ncbi:unnamed protein product [Mytilus coruscus]|uniref:B box-type domain-containing protein n=1 Tax=Mytilus coruscus TaxID=42192 RepID=A0A6J8EMK7_MYTCO|nr:unnamed protein product [Mytilus coruscus]